MADIDNDTDLDIILQGQNSANKGSTLVYTNDGQGEFTKKRQNNLIGMYDSVLAAGDIDNDGNIDLISAGKINAVTYETAIYLGDGTGGFSQTNEGIIYPINRGDLKLGDIDSDGDLDLIIIGGKSGGRVGSIYENEGDGFFIEINIGDIEPVIDGSLDLGDVDNDGDLDIILCGGKKGGSRFTRLYMNNGDGSFKENDSDFINVFSGDVHFGDIDGDGYLDLFVSGNSLQGTIVRAYLNDGSGYYDEVEISGIFQVYQSEIELFDINNDEKIDLVITGLDSSYKRKTRIYRNN